MFVNPLDWSGLAISRFLVYVITLHGQSLEIQFFMIWEWRLEVLKLIHTLRPNGSPAVKCEPRLTVLRCHLSSPKFSSYFQFIFSNHSEKRRMGRMILNNALRSIVNAERRGKDTVELKPISTAMSSFLKIMKDRGYIKDFQVFDPHRVGRIAVQLQGRVNDCKALTYRQDVKARDIEEYKMQKLPTRQWGYVVITTPEGVLDHEEAVKRNVGGQVLGYFH
ncbi:unnamed protein product [Malus baccata var. baccata]